MFTLFRLEVCRRTKRLQSLSTRTLLKMAIKGFVLLPRANVTSTDIEPPFHIASPHCVCDKPFQCHSIARRAGYRSRDLHAARLVRNRRLPRNHSPSGPVFPPCLRKKYRGLFRLRTPRLLVARRHLHGGNHFRRRYAPCGRRFGLHPRHRRKLDLVGVPALRDDDGFPVRAPVAPLRPDDRRAIRRDALCGKARRIPPRISRRLSRSAR